jgi:hypothetical protein
MQVILSAKADERIHWNAVQKLCSNNDVDSRIPNCRASGRLVAHDSLRGLAAVDWLSSAAGRRTTGRLVCPVRDWTEVAELGVGDDHLAYPVKRRHRSYFVATASPS